MSEDRFFLNYRLNIFILEGVLMNYMLSNFNIT